MKNLAKPHALAIFGASLLVLASGSALADQLDQIKARGTLVCGVLGTVPPFGFQNPSTREIVGYDVDMCRMIAKHLGVKPELKVVAPPARIPEVSQGRVDIVAGSLGWTPARAEQVDYSHGYYQVVTVLAYPASTPYKTWADLANKRIGAGNATTSAAAVKEKIPQATLVTFEDTSQVLLALRQRKVEAVAINEPMLRQYQLKVAGTPDAAELMMEPPLFNETYGIGVKKGEATLLNAVNKALEEGDTNGEIDKAFDTYLGKNSEFKLIRKFRVAPIRG